MSGLTAPLAADSAPSLAPSAHIDSFARDNLPPRALWPDLIVTLPELHYPERLNCATELLDKMVAAGHRDRPCVLAPGGLRWSYGDLLAHANRIARVLTEDLGVVPGNRVLLRAANTPMMIACWYAVMKVGAIAVATMPLLRGKELATIAEKARIRLALCDSRLIADMAAARERAPILETVVTFQGAADGFGPSLEERMADKPAEFANVDTANDDVCLIAFTSGTTGQPKGTMHFHRDVLAICDTFSQYVLKPRPNDLFCGSPPIAFTFGLGGLVTFPMRVGAATLMLEKAPPDELLKAIQEHKVTVCFTAPTAYRRMVDILPGHDISSLRNCVSAGEALPRPTWEAFRQATGLSLIDGIGATEMLHIFISAAGEDIRPGSTGRPVPGFEAKVIGEDGAEVPPGTVGRLAVRGPVGCRYLADDRQTTYVQNGWNVTGDAYLMDEDGYFWYQARADDMIVSAGYNIAGPEVEEALLAHPLVAECAVVGAPDDARGTIVKAFVVLRPEARPGPELVKALQDFVKQEIAPYKYPRAIDFVDALPRTETGKVQRFRLRDLETARGSAPS